MDVITSAVLGKDSRTLGQRARILAALPLPTRDRVDHDVRNAEDQEHGGGGVASVMKTAVSYPRVPKHRFQTRYW